MIIQDAINRINLIPRYNWDFGLRDFASGISSIFSPRHNNMERLRAFFGQEPIPTSAGRTSLYVILKALDLPKGAEVGVPLYCCPVVFDAIKRAGLKLRFIDVDPYTYTISAEDLERKRKSLAAVVVVHMFGHPADMDAISDAVRADFPVIEDCAQSLYSRYKGKITGFFGSAAFFSFRSAKYISAGEGSLILSNDPGLTDEIRRVANSLSTPSIIEEFMHCSSTLVKSALNKKPLYGVLGYPIGQILDNRVNLTAKTGFKYAKVKTSDISIITKRIQGFSKNIQKQRKNASYLLSKVDAGKLVLPYERKACYSNYYLFAIRLHDKYHRDSMSRLLLKNGVDNSKYLHEVVGIATKTYGYKDDCPNAEMCSNTVLVIPHYYTLSIGDLDYTAQSLNEGGRRLNTRTSF